MLNQIAESYPNLKYLNLEKNNKEAVDQLNRNIHVENFVMPPDFIGIVRNHLTLASLAQMRKQHRVGERILAPEWVFTLPI
ncbi:uncharacterized protein OCT59_007527 [Rhizophagus irregularis]|uniref:uncharacterized protein n=1 Tax=Rhizophagus irregularis TaxID=588596 RepID=UPI001A015E5A|nr:hypothetical protein OCT59_007527 [Rhizophagus irregularis]GET62231.1 hypothetical protein GLOIN_2v1787560 [Rhizophagus irregularis DAOM 181602=DAOM 197198]